MMSVEEDGVRSAVEGYSDYIIEEKPGGEWGGYRGFIG